MAKEERGVKEFKEDDILGKGTGMDIGLVKALNQEGMLAECFVRRKEKGERSRAPYA